MTFVKIKVMVHKKSKIKRISYSFFQIYQLGYCNVLNVARDRESNFRIQYLNVVYEMLVEYDLKILDWQTDFPPKSHKMQLIALSKTVCMSSQEGFYSKRKRREPRKKICHDTNRRLILNIPLLEVSPKFRFQFSFPRIRLIKKNENLDEKWL